MKELDKGETQICIKKALHAHLETGMIWSLRIVIPLIIVSPYLPSRTGGKLLGQGFSYFESLFFYTLIFISFSLLVFLWNRFKAFRIANKELVIEPLKIKVQSINKRRYFDSFLYVVKSIEVDSLLLLKDKGDKLGFKKGDEINVLYEKKSKVILKIER